eukprot:1360737-Pyramimonas_sp.AAC.1
MVAGRIGYSSGGAARQGLRTSASWTSSSCTRPSPFSSGSKSGTYSSASVITATSAFATFS